MSHNSQGCSSLRSLIPIGLALLLVSAGCWNPKMIHPYVYESGRVLSAGRAEIGGQFFPAGTAAVGLGRGFAARASCGYVGDDVIGAGGELTRQIFAKQDTYLSATAGFERFWSDDHDFDGLRIFGGLTASWYPGNRRFGLHLPLRVYSMSYDWGPHFDEWVGDFPNPEAGEGVLFVPGIALSLEWDHVAFRCGAGGATSDKLDDIELFPYLGAQLSLRLGRHPERAQEPSEF